MSGRCREESERQKKRAREGTSGGEGYSCVARGHSRCGAIPLTDPNGPGRDDPGGDAEDQQHSARAYGHQGLHHKACVKVHLQREKQSHVSDSFQPRCHSSLSH